MMIAKKAKKLVRYIAKNLSDSKYLQERSYLKDVFIEEISKLDDTPIKKELQSNIDDYFDKFRICYENKKGNKEDESTIESTLLADKELFSDTQNIHSNVKYPYNFYSDGKLNEECLKNYSIDEQIAVCRLYLFKYIEFENVKFSDVESVMEKIIQTNEKWSSLSEKVSLLNDMLMLKNDCALVKNIMYMTVMLMTPLIEKLDEDIKVIDDKSNYDLNNKLWNHIKLAIFKKHLFDEQSKNQKPTYEELMATLLSLYIDVEVIMNKKHQEASDIGQKVAQKVSIVLNSMPGYAIDVVAGLETLKSENSNIILPILTKLCLKPIIKDAESYTKYICVIRQIMSSISSELSTPFSSVCQSIIPPSDYADWLSKYPNVSDQIPFTKNFKGLAITDFFLKEADMDLVSLLLDVIASSTFDTTFATPALPVEKNEPVEFCIDRNPQQSLLSDLENGLPVDASSSIAATLSSPLKSNQPMFFIDRNPDAALLSELTTVKTKDIDMNQSNSIDADNDVDDDESDEDAAEEDEEDIEKADEDDEDYDHGENDDDDPENSKNKDFDNNSHHDANEKNITENETNENHKRKADDNSSSMSPDAKCQIMSKSNAKMDHDSNSQMDVIDFVSKKSCTQTIDKVGVSDMEVNQISPFAESTDSDEENVRQKRMKAEDFFDVSKSPKVIKQSELPYTPSQSVLNLSQESVLSSIPSPNSSQGSPTSTPSKFSKNLSSRMIKTRKFCDDENEDIIKQSTVFSTPKRSPPVSKCDTPYTPSQSVLNLSDDLITMLPQFLGTPQSIPNDSCTHDEDDIKEISDFENIDVANFTIDDIDIHREYLQDSDQNQQIFNDSDIKKQFTEIKDHKKEESASDIFPSPTKTYLWKDRKVIIKNKTSDGEMEDSVQSSDFKGYNFRKRKPLMKLEDEVFGARKTSGKLPTSKTPGKLPTGKTPGKSPTKKTPGKSSTEKTPGKLPTKKTPGKLPTKKTPGKSLTKKTPGKS